LKERRAQARGNTAVNKGLFYLTGILDSLLMKSMFLHRKSATSATIVASRLMAFFALGAFLCPSVSQSETTVTEKVPAGIVQLGNGSFYNPYAIVVDKTARITTVWKQKEDLSLEKVIEYPSDIGKLNGNKSKLGDHRTPEGIYFIQKMYEGPGLPFDKYGKRAFTLDYPNLFDQRAGKTGSGIWLHAIPDTETLERGSRGCVVLRNDSILDISKYITIGEKTPFLIYDKIPYQTQDERKKSNTEVEATLAKWLEAWKSENIDEYMKYYSEKFYSLKMNVTKWRQYKTELAAKYEDIQVSLYSPIVLEHSGGFVIRALQAYRSSAHQDFGEKVIYLEKTENGLKIVAEQWSPLPNQEIKQNLAKCCAGPDQARN
jgi:murein L,D-transpeptidase YafK